MKPKNLKKIPHSSALIVIREFTDAARAKYGSDSYATGYLTSTLAGLMAGDDLKSAILSLQHATIDLKFGK